MPTGPGGLDAQGVWQFGEDDIESLASDLLNLGMDSVSTQFGLDRARLDALEGSPTPGMFVVAPSSVSGSGVSLDPVTGLITFTAASSVIADGCYTPAFRNYRHVIDIDGATATATLRFQFRKDGVTDVGATNYGYRQILDGASAHSGPVAFWRLAPDLSAATVGDTVLDVFRPHQARATRGALLANTAVSASVGSALTASLLHVPAVAQDGCALSLSAAATITGTMRIYGYN